MLQFALYKLWNNKLAKKKKNNENSRDHITETQTGLREIPSKTNCLQRCIASRIGRNNFACGVPSCCIDGWATSSWAVRSRRSDRTAVICSSEWEPRGSILRKRSKKSWYLVSFCRGMIKKQLMSGNVEFLSGSSIDWSKREREKERTRVMLAINKMRNPCIPYLDV